MAKQNDPRQLSNVISSGGFLKLVVRTVTAVSVPITFANVASPSVSAQPKTIVSRMSQVGGIKLHYLTAGSGPAVVLLHGYTQTSRMWRPIIPLLAEKFTVIARPPGDR